MINTLPSSIAIFSAARAMPKHPEKIAPRPMPPKPRTIWRRLQVTMNLPEISTPPRSTRCRLDAILCRETAARKRLDACTAVERLPHPARDRRHVDAAVAGFGVERVHHGIDHRRRRADCPPFPRPLDPTRPPRPPPVVAR